MHPLFIAHLVADFLLQPTWLVEWKLKSSRGVVLHATIHLLVTAVLIWPQTIDGAILIAASAILHGYVDHIKIRQSRLSYNAAFILDQLAHLTVLIVVGILLPPLPAVWSSEGGRLMLAMLLFFSLGIGWHNLAHLQKTTKDLLTRIGLIVFAFGIFTTASLLLASRLCGAS